MDSTTKEAPQDANADASMRLLPLVILADNIANIESPAPVTSTGFTDNAGKA